MVGVNVESWKNEYQQWQYIFTQIYKKNIAHVLKSWKLYKSPLLGYQKKNIYIYRELPNRSSLYFSENLQNSPTFHIIVTYVSKS